MNKQMTNYKENVSNKTNKKLMDKDYLANINVFQCLYETCEDYLNEVAITYKADINVLDREKSTPTRFITYEELIKNILRTYDALKNIGIKKGDVITYASITTPEFIYTMYASVLAGAIFNPIDPRMKEEELLIYFKNEPSKLYFVPEKMFDSIRNIYNDINVKYIITMSFTESLPLVVKVGSKLMDLKNKIEPFKAPDNLQFMNWHQFIKNAKPKEIQFPKFERNVIISYTHTTGTTGVPKTLLHTNENWNAQWNNIYSSDLEIVRGESLFNVTVPWVDFGLILGIHVNLCNGVRMDLDPTWTPDRNVDYILKNRPDWWLGAPGWLDPLFTNSKYENENLQFGRYMMTGGAPLFSHKHKLYNDILTKKGSMCRVMPGYGLSEVSAPAFINMFDEPGTLGRPFPLLDYKIVDTNSFERVKKGEAGELWLRSVHKDLTPLAVGYLNNVEETEKTFVYDEGYRWVRTGDKVHQNDDGSVTWESRYKNILTYNGFNINCDKLLNEVEKISSVGKGAIIGAITEDGNQRPVICIELSSEYSLTSSNYVCNCVKKMIKDKLPEYYEPLDIVVYDRLPVKSMKINYNQLKKDNLNEVGEYVKSNEYKNGSHV